VAEAEAGSGGMWHVARG